MRIFLSFLILIAFSHQLIGSVNFTNLSGSDLALGIGSQQIALGGAGTLVEDAPGSIFWNAAGISRISHSQIQIDFQSFTDFKNAILIWKPDFFKVYSKQVTIGISAINRLRFIGSSDQVWSGYAAHLLDLTMIDLTDFTGKINSNTYDYRFNLALNLSSKLNAGITFVRLV
ncbi:MAG: hypothetical protein K9N09_02445 [Candidatus Cloacimonetes bacterium]|nr:hypothetical protein [Candidatus Cloacimonadota bacterium]MCF7813085.1 hypothetical protein [Candidatus Cloacimonadota bacterium]MCF7867534.1 hypothetical protein [Candidatus Cloacimonadota bacterium]MCF7883072.1 hypothetical protein [Candidatus Cloacimonadota bacterium]